MSDEPEGISAQKNLARNKMKAKVKLSGPVKIKAKLKVKAKVAAGDDIEKVAKAIRAGFGAASKGTILER